jgi:hypothetical protein
MPVLTDESNELARHEASIENSDGIIPFRGNSLDQIQTELSCSILSRQPTETAYQRRERLLPR